MGLIKATLKSVGGVFADLVDGGIFLENDLAVIAGVNL